MRRTMTALIAVGFLTFGCIGYDAGAHHALSPSSLAAADDCQMFPQTGFQVCGDFLNYWKANGGLAQQGYPISSTFQEKSETDGKTYTVQYFERAVFEAHPENQPPYNVLLSLLGSQKYKARYPNGAPTSAQATTAPPSQPTDGIGQTFTCICSFVAGASQKSITVTDIKRATLVGKADKPAGVFALVFARVTNLGNKPDTVSVGGVVLLDAQGRQYNLADVGPSVDAQFQYNVKGPVSEIQPSLTIDEVFLFDVSPDATGLKLSPAKYG